MKYNKLGKKLLKAGFRLRHILIGGSRSLDTDPPEFKFKMSKREIYQQGF